MRKKLSVLGVALLALGLAQSTPGFAWGDLGHQVVGEIAERLLTASDPATMKAYQRILGTEPFAVAAVWPDHVRSDPRFKDFATYHYVTIGDNGPIGDHNAITALKNFPNIVRNPSSTLEEKIIALRYMIHIFGDVHQPLHVGNPFDRGGNNCRVSWRPSDNALTLGLKSGLNLHAVWDTVLIRWMANRVNVKDFKEMSTVLMKKNPSLLPIPTQITIDTWIQESADLREKFAYPDRLPPQSRPYCQVASLTTDESTGVAVLNQVFITRSAKIAEKQLVMAGARLAGYLHSVLVGN